MKKLMIALLSCSASINTYADSGGLSIEIVAGMNKASSSVRASGVIKTPVTDSDLYGFGVSKIGHCLGVWSGHNPGKNVYTTYANDTKHNLFRKYNWTPVSRTLKAKSAKILEITAKPTIIGTADNTNISDVEGTFHYSIHEDITNSATSSWNTSNSLKISKDIDVGVKVSGVGASSKTEIAYTHSWGKGGSKEQKTTVGSGSDISVVLQPGQSATAELTSSKGSMKVEVTYEATLTGSVAVSYSEPTAQYGKTHGEHRFWQVPIETVFAGCAVEVPGGLSQTLTFKEIINVGYYSKSKLTLRPTHKTGA
jgi:hypothetical protein